MNRKSRKKEKQGQFSATKIVPVITIWIEFALVVIALINYVL